MEDNEAVIKICYKSRIGALRHCHRTHRVAMDWLFEVFKGVGHQLRYVRTIHQIVDIYIKAIAKPYAWRTLLDLYQIRRSMRSVEKQQLNACEVSNVFHGSKSTSKVCKSSSKQNSKNPKNNVEKSGKGVGSVCVPSLCAALARSTGSRALRFNTARRSPPQLGRSCYVGSAR